MTDVLTLAGVSFTGYSPPETMPGGGKQAMVVHKLPGGSRSIDTLGPDEKDIAWSGFFFSDTAFDEALYLDSLRAQGSVVQLQWGGQSRDVVIEMFEYDVRRLPNWVEYRINLVVAKNPQLGNLAPQVSSLDGLVSSDFAGGSAP